MLDGQVAESLGTSVSPLKQSERRLDRKAEQRRAEAKASEAKCGCQVLSEEEFWRELERFQDL
jgi:hypothetical protein